MSCEGYESSEDQYVLRGSCGLEYNLDYTELGLKKLKESGRHQGSSFSDYYHKWYSADSRGTGGLITVVVLLAIAFVVYKLFLSDGQCPPPPYSEYPTYSSRSQRFTNSAGPAPPGFKSEFTGGCPLLESNTLDRREELLCPVPVFDLEDVCVRKPKQTCFLNVLLLTTSVSMTIITSFFKGA